MSQFQIINPETKRVALARQKFSAVEGSVNSLTIREDLFVNNGQSGAAGQFLGITGVAGEDKHKVEFRHPPIFASFNNYGATYLQNVGVAGAWGVSGGGTDSAIKVQIQKGTNLTTPLINVAGGIAYPGSDVFPVRSVRAQVGATGVASAKTTGYVVVYNPETGTTIAAGDWFVDYTAGTGLNTGLSLDLQNLDDAPSDFSVLNVAVGLTNHGSAINPTGIYAGISSILIE